MEQDQTDKVQELVEGMGNVNEIEKTEDEEVDDSEGVDDSEEVEDNKKNRVCTLFF